MDDPHAEALAREALLAAREMRMHDKLPREFRDLSNEYDFFFVWMLWRRGVRDVQVARKMLEDQRRRAEKERMEKGV